MKILTTPEFAEWLSELGAKGRAQVDARLDRIQHHAHFGDTKPFGSHLFELRWKNGRRVYYTLLQDPDDRAALMLLGGDKNGQERDIAQARRILEREASQAGS